MIHDETGDHGIAPDLLIRNDDIALVYLTEDKKHDLRYEVRSRDGLSMQCRAFLSRTSIALAVSTHFLSTENRLQWKRMLGEGVSLALGGDLETADEIWNKAHAFLTNRAEESARMWYVQACVGLIIALLTAYGIFDASLQYIEPSKLATNPNDASMYQMGEDDVYSIKYVLLALISGAVGAGFSVLVRIGNLTIDPAAGWRSHYGEVLFRMTIGALAGAILIIGWQAEVFATFMKADSGSTGDLVIRASRASFKADFWKMIILALVAGASERMVPSLLQQLSNNSTNEIPAQAENESA